MDKEQARFILRSFRPDGADAMDRDFAQALTLAAEHRDLGEWLAAERAFDAAFATALTAVPLPPELRRHILDALARSRNDFPQAEDPLDASLIGAIAALPTPPDLRAKILAAMDRSTSPAPPRPVWGRLALPFAAAAGVTLAWFLTRDGPPDFLTLFGPVPVDVVQASFLRDFQAPDAHLELKPQDHRDLVADLKSRNLPCPCCLPDCLANVKGVGAREIVIHGKRGSLVCLQSHHGPMHLAIFHRGDLEGDLPQCGHPSFSQDGHWATARWADDHYAFILVGHTEVGNLAAMF